VENEGQDIVEGWASSVTKEEPTSSFRVGAIDVIALTTLGNFDHTNWRNMMVINMDWLTSYQGDPWAEWP
jgi:hypothetical protein